MTAAEEGGTMPTHDTTSRVPLVEVIITEGLDSRAAPRLAARLDDALDLRPAQLIVDVAACPMLDAAAIGVLLDAHRKTHRSGGVLTLRDPSPKLRRILRLARVDGVIDVIPKLAESDPACTTDRQMLARRLESASAAAAATGV